MARRRKERTVGAGERYFILHQLANPERRCEVNRVRAAQWVALEDNIYQSMDIVIDSYPLESNPVSPESISSLPCRGAGFRLLPALPSKRGEARPGGDQR